MLKKRVLTQKIYTTFNDLTPIEGWKIEGSTNMAHGNLQEKHLTQAVVFMIRVAGIFIVTLSWMSNKFERICGSTMEADTMVLVESMSQ